MADLSYVWTDQGDMEIRDQAPLDRALAAAIGFTQKELAINRAGQIAGTQFPRLAKQALNPLTRSACVLLGSLLILLIAYEGLVISRLVAPDSLLESVPRSVAAIVGSRLSREALIV